MDPAVDSGLRGVIVVFSATLLSTAIVVSFTACLFSVPAVAIVQGVCYITPVIVFPLRGVFIFLPTLVIALLRFLWTNFITLLRNLWTCPLHETILRVLEVMVWIFVGGGLIIATKPELLVNARWIFAFLQDFGPQFAQGTAAVVSKGAPLIYRAAIQLPAQTLQAIMDFPYILPDITTLEMTEEDNALPTTHITDLTEENNAPFTDLITAPPFTIVPSNSQSRNQAMDQTAVQRNLPDPPVEERDETELQALPPLPQAGTTNALYRDDASGSMDSHEQLPSYVAFEEAPPSFRSVAGTIWR